MKSYYIIFICLIFISCESKTISISEARSQSIGSKVTIKGTITAASGTYASSLPYGYAIQDKTAGIYVIDSIGSFMNEFKLGELVEVSGTIDKNNDLLVLTEISAFKKGKGYKITPLEVETGMVNESNEGSLVTTSGVIDSLLNDPPDGYKIYINDGSGVIDVYINASTGFLKDTVNWKIQDSISAIGVSSEYDNIFEVDPRVASDVKVLSNSGL